MLPLCPFRIPQRRRRRPLHGLRPDDPAERTSLAPDLPAIAEELKGYELIAWFALMAPAKTPNEIVQKVHDVAVKGLTRAEIKEKYATLGIDPAPLSPRELAQFIDSEIAHWAKLVKLAGIQPE